jgi:hypothetical protein
MTGGTFPKFAKLSTHHAPRKRGRSWLGALFMLVTAGTLLAWAPDAAAFSQYSEAGDATNCRACHGNFRANGYVSLKDGTPWNDDMHDGHRRDMLDGDCDTCHQASGRFPVILNNSAGGTGLPAIACVGCHGRAEDDASAGSGNPEPAGRGTGAGLRQQHWVGGVTVCSDCHADADPTSYTPVAENVPPPYYFTPDTAHPFKPTDACDANGTESVFGTLGLDNDGNGFIDGADVACAVVNDPPVAVNDSYTTDEDTALVVAAPGVLGNDTDTEGDPLTAVLDTDVSSGSLTLNADGSFTYTPNLNFNGTDSFTYHANDGADSNIATVTTAIRPTRTRRSSWGRRACWATTATRTATASPPYMSRQVARPTAV